MAHVDSTLPRFLRVRASGAVLALTLTLSVVLAGCTAGTTAPNNDSPVGVQQAATEPAPVATEPAPVNEAPSEPEPAPAGDTVTTDAIVGVWAPSDGSGIKIIDASGACSGMYYNNGTPLDIGGPMSCALGSQQRSDGSYLLAVTQAPNQASYLVVFEGNSFTLYSGDQAITMTRQ